VTFVPRSLSVGIDCCYKYLMETREVDFRWDASKAACPTRQVLGRIADKWTMLVVTSLEGGTLRFSQLRARIEGVTQKMLTQTLRGLERDGLIRREVFPTVPVTVEYSLTPLGRSLAEAVATIRRWAYDHMDDIDHARYAYDLAPSGLATRPDQSPVP